MAKKKSNPRGINGKPWFWWVTHYECGPSPTARRRGVWYLYRCYDKRRQLLYVGTTNDLARRFIDHRRDGAWPTQIARVVVVEFLDETSARFAELQTIWGELPAHNSMRQQRLTHGWDEERIEDFRARPQPSKSA